MKAAAVEELVNMPHHVSLRTRASSDFGCCAPPGDSAIYVGVAGWSIPAPQSEMFRSGSSHLKRYATRLSAVEINSSFYRFHQPRTYERWAQSTPPDFRFSVKVAKSLTHEQRLQVTDESMAAFLDGALCLGDKLGCFLVQTPPSLAFDADTADRFLRRLRSRRPVLVAWEARHASWGSVAAISFLQSNGVVQVIADPQVLVDLPTLGGGTSYAYFRQHGSPRMYYSNYDNVQLATLADSLKELRGCGTTCWCVFDNTAEGHAVENALTLQSFVKVDIQS